MVIYKPHICFSFKKNRINSSNLFYSHKVTEFLLSLINFQNCHSNNYILVAFFPLLVVSHSHSRRCRYRQVLLISKNAKSEVRNHKRKSFMERNSRFPAKKLLSLWNVWPSLVWIILCVWPELYFCIWIYCLLHHLQIWILN